MTNLAALRVALTQLQTNHERNMKYHDYATSKESVDVARAIDRLSLSIAELKGNTGCAAILDGIYPTT